MSKKLLEIRSSFPVVSSDGSETEALQNFTSFTRKYLQLSPFLSKTLSIHAMPSNLQLYFKEHHHWWFSVNIFMWKYFFIASFHANMYSQMFYKIDVPENPVKFTGNWVYQTLLTPTQIFFWESFEIFRNTFFTEHLRTSASDFNSIFLLF